MKPYHYADIVESVLLECQAKVGLTNEQACEIELKMRHEFGGSEVYVPKKLAMLNSDVIESRRNSGESMEKIANHFGITRMTIYNILRRGRKDEVMQVIKNTT